MNILISQTYAIYTPDDLTNGGTDNIGYHFYNMPHTFREIVELLKTHNEPSHYPVDLNCAADTWFTYNDANNGTIESIEQGIQENTAIHFSHDNNARALRYWRLAIRYAGIK